MSTQPIKNQEHTFYVFLVSQSTGQVQSNPTIAAGDFKRSIDGAAYANFTNLPAVDPVGSKSVKIILSSTEMNCNNLVWLASDAAGAEWDDVGGNIQPLSWLDTNDDLTDPRLANLDATVSSRASQTSVDSIQTDTDNIQSRLPAALSSNGYIKSELREIDGFLTSGNFATLNLKQLNIQNSAGSALVTKSTGTNGHGMDIAGNGSGHGINIINPAGTGDGIHISIPGSGMGIDIDAGSNIGVSIYGGTDGIRVEGDNYGANLVSGGLASITFSNEIEIIDGFLNLATIANAIWTNATRTLTSFGTLVADIWALAIETGYTAKQSMRLMLSALAGKLSGAATTTVTIRDVNDSKDRITATVDGDGNRTAVTKDVSD